MSELQHPAERADGKPWVPWETALPLGNVLPGHRERITLEAWWDREKQSLVLAIVQYDESMSEFMPCWAQLALIDCGPFFAKNEVLAYTDIFADAVITAFDLGGPPS